MTKYPPLDLQHQQQQQQQLLLLQKNCVSYSTDIHLDNHVQISMILYNAVKNSITLFNHPSIIMKNSDGDREDESFKQAFANRIFDIVEEFCPGFQASVLHRDVLSPLDLERIFGLPGGSISHGALSLNQLGYSRPIAGNDLPFLLLYITPWSFFSLTLALTLALFLGDPPLVLYYISYPSPHIRAFSFVGYADYRTPISGLYLCSAGTHPGE